MRKHKEYQHFSIQQRYAVITMLLFPILKKLCKTAEKRLIPGNFRNIETSEKLPKISREYTLNTHYYLPGTLSIASMSIESE